MLEAPTDRGVMETPAAGWSGGTGAAWLADQAARNALVPCRALVLAADMEEEVVALCRNGFTTFVVDASKETLGSLRDGARRHGAQPTLVHADILACPPSLFGPVELIWDRTFFHRLSAARRAAWAHKAARILPSGGRFLGLFRIGPGAGGPPYAVTRDALTHLLARHFAIEELSEVGSVPPGSVRTFRGAFRRK
jgi:hypothetical protein